MSDHRAFDLGGKEKKPPAPLPDLPVSFVESFRDGIGSCRGECACGAVFYNPEGGWDFEKGEIEALRASNAIDIYETVSFISFEGSTYVLQCECWKDRAKRIAAFLTGHAWKIAEFLREEKKRKQEEAERSPVV